MLSGPSAYFSFILQSAIRGVRLGQDHDGLYAMYSLHARFLGLMRSGLLSMLRHELP